MKTSKISLQILANTSIALSEENGSVASQKREGDSFLSISFTQPEPFNLGETKVIPFTFDGKPVTFEVMKAPQGWTATLLKINDSGGSIAITATNFHRQCKGSLSLILSNNITSTKVSIALALDPYTIPVGTVCFENGRPVGVVFRSKTKHQKGLIVHKEDTSSSWGCPSSLTYAIDRDNGSNNVNRIEAIDNTLESYPSFSWCRSHGDQWYMPSLHELLNLFYNKAEVNSRMYEIRGVPLTTDGAAYWASNEVNDSFAWSVYFQDGHLNYHKKEYNKLVRAICAF